MKAENSMPFLEIKPFVRHVQLLPIKPGEYPSFTRSYDCRLFYVSRGEGHVFMQDQAYPVDRGDLVLWQSGVNYRMETGDAGMQFLCVNFDFTTEFSQQDYPIPPDRFDLFDDTAATPHVRFPDAPAFDAPVFLTGMQVIEETLVEMKREYTQRKVYWRERQSALMASILSRIARSLSAQGAQGARVETRIDPVIAYIQEHFSEQLDNETLGRLFSYHPNYLNRQMLLLTGKTLRQYLISCRVQKAIEYLEGSDLPISEIAQLTGYGDMCHFSKLFKQKTGNNPSSYRRPK